MTKQAAPRSTGRVVLMAVVVAVISGVAVVLAQKLFMGEVNAAVSGGVVGAVTATMVVLDQSRAKKQKGKPRAGA